MLFAAVHRSLLTQQRHWLCNAAMILMPVSAPYPNIRAEGFRDSKKTLVLKKVALIRRFWRFTWRV
jgi:hypothetical protein